MRGIPFIIIIFFVSCGTSPPIEEGKLYEIIRDVHFIKSSTFFHYRDSLPEVREEKTKNVYPFIEEKYNITKQEFDSAIKFFIDKNSKALNEIYRKISEEFKNELDSLTNTKHR